MSALLPVSPDRIVCYQSHQAWLDAREEARKTHAYQVSGSVLADLLGYGAFEGAGEWRAVMRMDPRFDQPSRSSDAMARGQRWETRVLEDFAHETGRRALHGAVLCDRLGWPGCTVATVYGPKPWMVATLDALVLDGPVVGVGEAKTSVKAREWGESGKVVYTFIGCNGIIPMHYACQVYWYLACTGLPWCDLAVLIPRSYDFPELRHFRIMYDQESVDTVVEQAAAWRQKLIDGWLPPVDGSEGSSTYLTQTYRPPANGTKSMREATEEERDLMLRYQAGKALLERVEDEVGKLRAQLTERIGNDYGIDFGGGVKAIWYPVKGKPSVDQKKLQAQFPEAWDACTSLGAGGRYFRLVGG